MTNFEWLISEKKSELQTILGKGDLGLNKDTNEVCACEDINCAICAFNHDGDLCGKWRSKWLNEPHSKFQKGDLVKIINSGAIYTDYVDWVIDNVDDKTLVAKWAYQMSLLDSRHIEYRDHTFKVMAIGNHGTMDRTLVYIQDDTSFMDECFVIDEDGLEKIGQRI